MNISQRIRITIIINHYNFIVNEANPRFILALPQPRLRMYNYRWSIGIWQMPGKPLQFRLHLCLGKMLWRRHRLRRCLLIDGLADRIDCYLSSSLRWRLHRMLYLLLQKTHCSTAPRSQRLHGAKGPCYAWLRSNEPCEVTSMRVTMRSAIEPIVS